MSRRETGEAINLSRVPCERSLRKLISTQQETKKENQHSQHGRQRFIQYLFAGHAHADQAGDYQRYDQDQKRLVRRSRASCMIERRAIVKILLNI